MIDNDFHKSNGTNNSGMELISQFISSKKENHIYALTSAQIDNSTTNEIFRENLESDDYSQTLLACVIHNQVDEERVITSVFLYKFLNDKFMFNLQNFANELHMSVEEVLKNENDELDASMLPIQERLPLKTPTQSLIF